MLPCRSLTRADIATQRASGRPDFIEPQAEILASFLLSETSSAPALWSGIIMICCFSAPVQDTAFALRVALCDHWETRYNAGRMVRDFQAHTSSQSESALAP
jgi:hypothetical protein